MRSTPKPPASGLRTAAFALWPSWARSCRPPPRQIGPGVFAHRRACPRRDGRRHTPGAVVRRRPGRPNRLREGLSACARRCRQQEPMTLDTVFDLASLTKVVATTTAVMTLVEEGRLRLNDPVASYVPGFERYGKGGITIRHLMTHVSGLRPDVDLHPWTGYDAAIELAKDEVPTAAPGEAFVYSDINFFLLGDIVAAHHRRSRSTRISSRGCSSPLGMTETGFLPPKTLLPRIAPTERCGEQDAWPCKRPDLRRRCAASFTIRRRGAWAASPGTPASSAPRTTCSCLRACCSARDAWARRGCCPRRV